MYETIYLNVYRLPWTAANIDDSIADFYEDIVAEEKLRVTY